MKYLKKIPWWGWLAVGGGALALVLFRSKFPAPSTNPNAGYSPSAVGLTQGMGVYPASPGKPVPKPIPLGRANFKME